MKLQIASDLHLEYSRQWQLPFAAADVLILAGDIGPRALGLAAFRERARRQPIIYVAGNHEYYGGDLFAVSDEIRTEARQLDVHYLENDELRLEGVRFLGATLWTDFDLYGETGRAEAMRQAGRKIPDYHVISYGKSGWLRPEHTRSIHQDSLAWLQAKLAENFSGATVVVSHHAPHPGSLHPRFQNDPLSPAFVSNLAKCMSGPKLWIHGHTHDSFDYTVAGTRVICNPRGYDAFELNTGFNPECVVEI